MQKWIIAIAGLFFSYSLYAQQGDSSHLIRLNQQIDDLVIKRDVAALDSFYADDFVMIHGDGRTDPKKAWLAAVAKSNYSTRQHDSVKAELHNTIAIVKGKMLVQKAGAESTAVPYRTYIRVFALRDNRWQLLSHYTMYNK